MCHGTYVELDRPLALPTRDLQRILARTSEVPNKTFRSFSSQMVDAMSFQCEARARPDPEATLGTVQVHKCFATFQKSQEVWMVADGPAVLVPQLPAVLRMDLQRVEFEFEALALHLRPSLLAPRPCNPVLYKTGPPAAAQALHNGNGLHVQAKPSLQPPCARPRPCSGSGLSSTVK